MIVAEITAGAFAGSTSLTVAASVAGGTLVVVYRGGFYLGSGLIAAGLATVVVPALATGDYVQASVSERGNQAGIPVLVTSSANEPSGWLLPGSITVTGPDGGTTVYTAVDYEAEFGQQPGAVYDPLLAGATRIQPEYTALPQVELGFDLRITMQPGSTSLVVVPRAGETLLVGYNLAPVGSNTPFTVTTSGNVAVAVKRSDNPVPLSRTVNVTVLPAAGATPSGGDIIGVAYRIFDGNYVRMFINSAKPCEAQLNGFSSTWLAGVFYGSNYQEVDWPSVPGGTYTLTARVVGDATSANYKSITITI